MTTSNFMPKLAAAVMIVLLLTVNTFAGPAMKPVVSLAGRFAVSMPGTPDHQGPKANGPQDFNSWTLKTSSGDLYIAAYSSRSPNETSSSTALEFVKGLKGQISKQSDATIDGRPGLYTTGTTDTHVFHHFVTVSGSRIYQFLFMTGRNNPIPAEAREFVNSFQLF